MQKKYTWILGIAWLICMALLFSVWPVPDPLNDQLPQKSRFAEVDSENIQDSSPLDQFKAEAESEYEGFPEVGDEGEDNFDQGDELDEEDEPYEEDPDPIVSNW